MPGATSLPAAPDPHESRATDTVGPDTAGPLRLRSLFISDIGLGTPECRADKLLELLRHAESEHLYLVGNVFDGRQIRRRFYWHQTHNDVVQKLLRKARKGTRVAYVAGDHDDAVRHFLGLAFGGIEIMDEAVHRTADGRAMLVVHGARFEAPAALARWLPRAAPTARDVDRFEEAAAREAQRRGLHGVVCGHIRRAGIREVGGILYCNGGDWVHGLTAIAELESGELRLLDWRAVEAASAKATAAALPGAVTCAS